MEKQIHILPALLPVCPALIQLEETHGAAKIPLSFLYINMQNGAERCAATRGVFNRGYIVSICFLSATLHVCMHTHTHTQSSLCKHFDNKVHVLHWQNPQNASPPH